MTTHSELTRRHTPPHIQRRRFIWAPTIAVGALLFLAAPNADLAGVFAFTALLCLAAHIGDNGNEETP